LKQRREELAREVARPELWQDPGRAQETLKEEARIRRELETFTQFESELEEIQLLLNLAEEEKDLAEGEALSLRLEKVRSQMAEAEMARTLPPEDNRNAIFSVNAGAGGTDAQDWAEMLLRMYLRWAERRGFRVEILDRTPGEEAGIKSATVAVSGENVYGFLKAEIGVHRLVRLSRFDFNQRRHTSFAAVFVYPEVQDEQEIIIEEKDLRVETFRAGGHGGQNVNKVSSAVRVYHLPTGMVVTCQNERSQYQNRIIALRILKSRLLEQKRQAEEAEKEKLYQKQKSIAWGSQIRSYILHPYHLVKDHRTEWETSAVDKVLDGDLDGLIRDYLLKH
jgi:peptide chain release factor 2